MFMLDPTRIRSTYGYHPLPWDAPAVASGAQFAGALILGEDIPDLTADVEVTRVIADPEVNLPRGLYWFGLDEPAYLMVVDHGSDAQAPETAEPDELDESHPLVVARAWFAALWEQSTPIPRPRFGVGDAVLTVPGGQLGTIADRSFDRGQWFYGVQTDGRRPQLAERNLDAVPDVQGPVEWVQGVGAPVQRFAATLTRAKLDGTFTDTVFSFRATRTMFRPYQFKPVIKFLETGKPRMLIADEVGLGKTIEAGLLWTEMEARGLANRVLVLSPSSLVAKWRREMEERFGFALEEWDAAGLKLFAERLEADRLPARSAYISSIERLRTWPGLERAIELRPQFDLVIVDEAHAFRNLGTRSNALGRTLSDWSEALVFLSATPLNLRNDDLFNLMELLVPGDFDSLAGLEQQLEPNAVLHRISASMFDPSVGNDERVNWLRELDGLAFGPAMKARPEFEQLSTLLAKPQCSARDVVSVKRLIADLHALSAVVTRTRKVEVLEEKPVRAPQFVAVTWTASEQAFYDAHYTWCELRAKEADMPIGFAMQMPLRLSSSCLPAAAAVVLDWKPGSLGERDEDSADRSASASSSVPPGPELVLAARAIAGVDSKFDSFLPVLQNLVRDGRQVLVFTFSRKTIAYLQRRLHGQARVAVLHGGIPPAARHTIISEFRDGKYDVVLANRVASEGLDFEFCSVVVNYDLPWNPMEVEQRIGRIDRIGQQERKIVVVNFHTPGTIETTIVERVMERIGVFSRSIGELEPILQSSLQDLQQAIWNFDLSPEQRERRANEVLAALEERQLAREDVESASEYLMSSDQASIEGLEHRLVGRGRYAGQEELALLIEDWTTSLTHAPAPQRRPGHVLTVRGTTQMADQVLQLAAVGERSRREVEDLAQVLRQEGEVHLSLDQERARTSGLDLLAVNHPLVRAALRVPGHKQARFARLIVTDSSLTAGRYLIVLSLAAWTGVRTSREIWSTAVELESLREAPETVADAVLTRLADGSLIEHPNLQGDLVPAAQRAQRLLLRRQDDVEHQLRKENEALLEVRRVSVDQSHRRRVERIDATIASLRNNPRVFGLFEAQRAHAESRRRQAVAELDQASACALAVEPFAVCALEVRS